ASVRHSGSLIGQTVTIHARDDSPLDADSASLAAGLLGGAGGSIARNVMGTAVSAGIGGARGTRTVGQIDIAAAPGFGVGAFPPGPRAPRLPCRGGRVPVHKMDN